MLPMAGLMPRSVFPTAMAAAAVPGTPLTEPAVVPRWICRKPTASACITVSRSTYVVAPPSLHRSGQRYEVDGLKGAEAFLNVADIPEWLLRHISVPCNVTGNKTAAGGTKWGPGERNNKLTSEAGSMRRRGLPLEAITAALLEINEVQCDPPLPEDEVRRIAESVSRYEPESSSAPGQEPHGRRAEASDDWPKPEPMQDELPPVQPFSEDLLPDSFRPLVGDVTERMQVPLDFPAAVIVLCLAGAVNRRAIMQPLANDTGWTKFPNLWGSIVADPGLKKSPVIQAVTRPLAQIQEGWWLEHKEALKQYARDKEEHRLKYAAWQEEYKRHFKKGTAPLGRPEDEPEQPELRRLIGNDATFEALHQTMAANPAGVLVIRDELTGLLSRLDQEQFGSERAFYLSAWNGDTPHTIDRITRGTIHVPHCCLSMLGRIQPGRLRSYLADALKDGPSNDGLIQRLQLLVWPDKPTDWRLVDRKPNEAYEKSVYQIFRKLVQLDCDKPLRARFDPEAQQLFNVWLTELEKKLLAGGLHPALVSHLSKYRSLMPSLALLFELADQAAAGVFDVFGGSDPGGSQNFSVSLDHARQAAASCDCLESHARRFYPRIVTPQIRAARELADYIKRKQVTNKDGGRDWFTSRDVYRKGWTGLDSPEAVARAAEVLQDAEWLRPVAGESSDPLGRGRPFSRWVVNPRVWQ
jgi:Protein of unknown function (DUF3987)/Primase C terminal 1 (PriCT-1)